MSDLLPMKDAVPMPPEHSCASYSSLPDYGALPPRARIQRFLAFLRKLWWVPVITLVIMMGTTIYYALVWMPPSYVSRAAMWETEKLRLPDGATFTEDLQTRLGTQIELLRSGRMRELALTRLKVSGTNSIPLDPQGKPLPVKLKIIQAPKSSILVTVASSAHPAYSQAFLNALMNEYLAYKKTIRKVVSGDTLASISEQVLRLERDLKEAQDALTAFQRTNNLALLQEEGTIAGSYLARLKTQLSDLILESQILEATALEQEGATRGATNVAADLAEAMRRLSSPGYSAASSDRLAPYQEVEILKIQRQKLSKFLRPKHPKIVKLDADIERAQKLIDLLHHHSRDQLAASRQALQMKMESVQASIKEWEGKVVEANLRIAEAEHLRLNVSRAQSLYDRLITLLQNVDISRNIDQETLAVLDPASPALPSYKEKAIVISLGALAGLSLGLAIIFRVAVRDDRFASHVEINEEFGDSIVGQVPEMPKVESEVSSALLGHNDERYAYAESYRSLRSALLFLPTNGENRPKILLITSAVPNEGKSTIFANLAKTMAMGGSRVLLVDGDLRKGHLHKMLGLQRDPGFSDLLSNSGDLDAVIQTNGQPNLAFISCGGSSTNPSDLFLSPRLDDVLAQCRQQYDYVLIDSTPVLAADDATTLAPKVDGTLFVVRRQFSSAAAVREALELLNHRQTNVLGIIFNRADASSRSYYYKYADYYRQPKTEAAKPSRT